MVLKLSSSCKKSESLKLYVVKVNIDNITQISTLYHLVEVQVGKHKYWKLFVLHKWLKMSKISDSNIWFEYYSWFFRVIFKWRKKDRTYTIK